MNSFTTKNINQIKYYLFGSILRGWALDSVENKLTVTGLDWMRVLTNNLDIWSAKSKCLSEGELLLV